MSTQPEIQSSKSPITPLPWRRRPNSAHVIGRQNVGAFDVVAHVAQRGNAEANAEFIVRACNNHEALLSTLKEIIEMLRQEAPGTPLNNHRFDALGIKANNAIAKAESR